MAEADVSGSGIHPGKPIIWPTSKGAGSPVSGSGTAESAGGVRAGASTPTSRAARPGEVSAPVDAAAGRAATPPRQAANIARPLTIEDIRLHLLTMQVPDSDFNIKLASLMLREGIEVSRSNMLKALSMLEGTDKSQAMQEAAMVLLMKGIDSPQALRVLGKYFAENPQMASQLLSLQQSLGNLTTALGASKGLLDPTLLSQISAMLTQFDDTVKNIPTKYRFSGDNSINRETLMNDVRALKALLEGVQQHASSSGKVNPQMLATLGDLNKVLDNLIAQAVLSQSGRQEVNYLYHQIPNSLVSPPKTMDIVIQREGEGEQSNLDATSTRIIISFEMANLGKMVLTLIIKNKKIYCIFVFNEKEHGEEARKNIAKEFGDLQKKLSDHDYAVTGYQVKVDPIMCSIKPYLIPLLPKIEELLRRIDLEA